jgi:hypothetical protein
VEKYDADFGDEKESGSEDGEDDGEDGCCMIFETC